MTTSQKQLEMRKKKTPRHTAHETEGPHHMTTAEQSVSSQRRTATTQMSASLATGQSERLLRHPTSNNIAATNTTGALPSRSCGRLFVGTPRAHAKAWTSGRLSVVPLLAGCIEGRIGSVQPGGGTETRRSGTTREWINNPVAGGRLPAAPVPGREQHRAD